MELGALVAHSLFKRGTIFADAGSKSAEVLDGLGDGLRITTR